MEWVPRHAAGQWRRGKPDLAPVKIGLGATRCTRVKAMNGAGFAEVLWLSLRYRKADGAKTSRAMFHFSSVMSRSVAEIS